MEATKQRQSERASRPVVGCIGVYLVGRSSVFRIGDSIARSTGVDSGPYGEPSFAVGGTVGRAPTSRDA